MGRPRKTWSAIEEDQFRKLCSIFCTRSEVASIMGVDVRTLDRLVSEHFPESPTWPEAFDRFSSAGRASLRRKQFEVAMGGDRAMLIFLGKNYLGQSDLGARSEERPSGQKLTAIKNAGKFIKAANG